MDPDEEKCVTISCEKIHKIFIEYFSDPIVDDIWKYYYFSPYEVEEEEEEKESPQTDKDEYVNSADQEGMEEDEDKAQRDEIVRQDEGSGTQDWTQELYDTDDDVPVLVDEIEKEFLEYQPGEEEDED